MKKPVKTILIIISLLVVTYIMYAIITKAKQTAKGVNAWQTALDWIATNYMLDTDNGVIITPIDPEDTNITTLRQNAYDDMNVNIISGKWAGMTLAEIRTNQKNWSRKQRNFIIQMFLTF